MRDVYINGNPVEQDDEPMADAGRALELLGAYLDGHKGRADQWMVLDAYCWLMRDHDGAAVAESFLPAVHWRELAERYANYFGQNVSQLDLQGNAHARKDSPYEPEPSDEEITEAQAKHDRLWGRNA